MKQLVLRSARRSVRFGLSGAVLMILSTTAGAQEQKGLDETLQIKPPRVRIPQSIHYSTWRKLCFKGSDDVTLCRTTSTGTDETNVVVIRVDLIERADSPAARFQLFVPQGLSLQAGVKLIVDQGAPNLLPYNFCLTNICIAAASAAPSTIKEMESGQVLTIEQVDFNASPVRINIPLSQFAAAHQGSPAASYNFNLEEDE